METVSKGCSFSSTPRSNANSISSEKCCWSSLINRNLPSSFWKSFLIRSNRMNFCDSFTPNVRFCLEGTKWTPVFAVTGLVLNFDSVNFRHKVFFYRAIDEIILFVFEPTRRMMEIVTASSSWET